MRGPGSIPTGGTFYHWIFCFHAVKTKMPPLPFSTSLCKNSIIKQHYEIDEDTYPESHNTKTFIGEQ